MISTKIGNQILQFLYDKSQYTKKHVSGEEILNSNVISEFEFKNALQILEDHGLVNVIRPSSSLPMAKITSEGRKYIIGRNEFSKSENLTTINAKNVQFINGPNLGDINLIENNRANLKNNTMDQDVDKKIVNKSTEPTSLFQSEDKIRILFLAASPKDTPQLEVDKEYKSLRDALQKSEYRDQFDLRQERAVSSGELQELLLQHGPEIVHFSGHGSQESAIVLQKENGNPEIVPPNALTNLFRIVNTKKKIQCVILSACYAEKQAEAIAKYVPCTIGMSTTISDMAATKFAISFYRGLGYGRSVNDAFDLGCNELAVEGIPEESTPRLKYAPGVDPSKVFLVKKQSRSS